MNKLTYKASLAIICMGTLLASTMSSPVTLLSPSEALAAESRSSDRAAIQQSTDNEYASDILKCLHISGQFVSATFGSWQSVDGGIKEREININWKGGFLGTPYYTRVADQKRGDERRIRVISDSAIIRYNEKCHMLGWR